MTLTSAVPSSPCLISLILLMTSCAFWISPNRELISLPVYNCSWEKNDKCLCGKSSLALLKFFVIIHLTPKQIHKHLLMAWWKTAVMPVHQQYSYCSLMLSHRYEDHDMGQVTKLWLSCYLVLLSIDSKTITSPDPSDTGDIIMTKREIILTG